MHTGGAELVNIRELQNVPTFLGLSFCYFRPTFIVVFLLECSHICKLIIDVWKGAVVNYCSPYTCISSYTVNNMTYAHCLK